MFDIKLVQAVRRYPCLYDHNVDRTQLIINMAWKAVSDKVGEDIKSCRSRWRTVRDRFVREHRINKHVSDWELRKYLLFLKDFIGHKGAPANHDYGEKGWQLKRQSQGRSQGGSWRDKVSVSSNNGNIDDDSAEQETNNLFKNEYFVEEFTQFPNIQNAADNSNEQSFYSSERNPGEHSTRLEGNEDTINILLPNQELDSTSHKRPAGEKGDTNKSEKKKRKLFLSDLIEREISMSSHKPANKKHKENERQEEKYENVLCTLNEYIRDRIREDEERNGNGDFFKVLDTYLMKLPEDVQDKLMAKILIKVLNKNN